MEDCTSISGEFIIYTAGYHILKLSYLSMIVEKEFEIVTENMKSRINWLIRLEEQPFTQNGHYFSSCRDKYLAHFKGRRQNCLIEGEFHIKAVLINLAGGRSSRR